MTRNIFLLSLLAILASCASTSYDAVYPTLSDGKYDSEFPYRNCSGQLEDISHSLVKLDVLVFYETYTFLPEQKTDIQSIREAGRDLKSLAAAHDIYSESVGGTAMVIHHTTERIAVLSCAHIVDYPDTVITRFPYPDDNYIQVIGIKARQQNSIGTIEGLGDLNLLVADSRQDIAILGGDIAGGHEDIKVFGYPIGDSGELEWGSFVYIMGFPLGHAMITRGIVSDPARIRKGSFLIDAVFNKGFSGGPVIAVRDGVPNFELVGMVRSAAATNRYYLAPEGQAADHEGNIRKPYVGEIILEKDSDIKYGITFSVTTASLRDFYRRNKTMLEENGYFLEGFFK